MHRLLLAVLTVAGAFALLAAPAGAATKFDTSYQNAGMLELPQIRNAYGQVAQTCSVAGSRMHLAGRFGPNTPGAPTAWKTSQFLATTAVSLQPRQPMVLGVASVRWTRQRIPTGHVVLGQSFDSAGGFAYATRSPKDGERTKLKLFRISRTGRRLAGFARHGYISVTIAGFSAKRPAGFRVIALSDGGVLLIAQTSSRQILLRYTKSGTADKRWGGDGSVQLAAPRSSSGTPLKAVDSASVTSDGGLLIGASGVPGASDSGKFGVLRLTATGKPMTSWGEGGLWLPPVPKEGAAYTLAGQSLLTAPLNGGGFAVLYADRTAEKADLKLAYVDQKSGLTTLFNDKVGSYSAADDTPDAEPWLLAASRSGMVFARASSAYGSPGGILGGLATRFSTDADQPVASHKLASSGFAAGALATDPKSNRLYFCGSFGVTSKRAMPPVTREQRKAVAIKRLVL